MRDDHCRRAIVVIAVAVMILACWLVELDLRQRRHQREHEPPTWEELFRPEPRGMDSLDLNGPPKPKPEPRPRNPWDDNDDGAPPTLWTA